MSGGWYSVAGYLQMKCHGGALTLWKPRRRYYFVLDEANCELSYFKDESEFIRKRPAVGQVYLRDCAVTAGDTGPRSFTIRVGGRRFELEADNDKTATVWLNALQRLQHRKDGQRLLSDGLFGMSSVTSFTSSLNFGSPADSRSRHLSSSSLPSDVEIAECLENAFQGAMRPHKRSESVRQPTRFESGGGGLNGPPATFYFASGASDSADDESRVPTPTFEPHHKEMMDDEAPVGRTRHPTDRGGDGAGGESPPPQQQQIVAADNAESLQHWIRSWLGGQQQMMTSSEPIPVQSDSDTAPSSPTKSTAPRTSLTEHDRDLLEEEWQRKEVQYKHEVQLLNSSVKQLTAELEVAQRCSRATPEEYAQYLKEQNKFLNSEIVRLSAKWQCEQAQYSTLNTRIHDLEKELDQFKQQYVYLLQSCIRIPVSEKRSLDLVEVKLFGGDMHKRRVRSLLDEARETDPTLPTFESLTNGDCHVDVYGFSHSFTDDGLALQYICTQLHQHYQSHLSAQQQHRHRWKLYLASSKNILVNTKEVRDLVRSGIPPSYRSAVWRCLIHQQVVDYKIKYGKYYFRNLSSTHGDAEAEYATLHEKQITLDLLRTMPSNTHFASAACKGISQLQQVLRAFCLHNPTIGYCQGMNFIAATCLLFLSPEDAFWFLVALTERYFVPSYFDSSLTGAQADQEVLKELVEEKLPGLSEHLERCDIDLATVTLNWFLALFFDGVPFHTMLRIWDCFLLEGPKVLFRFALALLGLHESTVMERCDTISVMKVLKAAARLTYDPEGLIKLAFEGLQPFPRRQHLIARQTSYLKLLKDRLQQRERLRDSLATPAPSPSMGAAAKLQLEKLAFCPQSEIGLLAFGHRDLGKIALLDVNTSLLQAKEIEFDCRILSVIWSDPSRAFISLISSYLVAVEVTQNEEVFSQCNRLWELRLTDIALDLIFHGGRIYAALANGSLAVIENVSEREPTYLDLFYIPIGPAPLTVLAVESDTHLWCAMGNKAIILNIKTLDCVEQLFVAGSASGGSVSMFEKIRAVVVSAHGVWLTTANSPLLQLWDAHTFTCRLLFDICGDHRGTRRGSDPSSDSDVQVSALLCCESTLWVGTADGYLMLYDVVRKFAAPPKYLPGQRLSPTNSTGKNLCIPPRESDRMSQAGSDCLTVNTTGELDEEEIELQLMSINTGAPDSGYSESVDDAELRSPNGTVDTEENLRQFFAAAAKSSACARANGSAGRRPSGAAASRVARRKQRLARTKSAVGATSTTTTAATDSQEWSPRARANSDRRPPPTAAPGRKKSVDASTARISVRPKSTANLVELGGTWSTDRARTLPARRQRNLSFIDRLYSSSSSASVDTTSSNVYEFDDFFRLYQDEAPEPAGASGGLCSDLLARSESVWSLQGGALPWSVDAVAKPTSKSAGASPSHLTARLRRKDLEFDCIEDMRNGASPAMSPLDGVPQSETASVLSFCSAVEPPFGYSLSLQMKLKISDKPVKSLAFAGGGDKKFVVSCSGEYGEEESVLRWVHEEATGLWINDPVIDPVHIKRRFSTLKHKPAFKYP